MANPKPAPDPTERRAKGPLAVSRLTDRLTRAALGKRGFTDAAVVARWPEIVGADLAAFACPMQVKYPPRYKKGGRTDAATLVLRVSSSAAAAMLQLKTPQILARVNAFFGYAAVARLEASHGPLPPRPAKGPAAAPDPVPSPAVDTATAQVASEDLRNALRKLGARLQHRTEARVVTRAGNSPPEKD
ncbi:MAG: DciA family protein [Rhodospirillaceae bacterium]|nr:DciA family protein [Rhodospirillaceae bacterium]